MKQGWEIKKLGEVCEVITKGTTPTSLGFKFTDEGVNFIKVESLTESGQIIPNKVAYISEECHESLKRSQLKENDILFSIAGALGRIGIVNKAIVPANTNQALAIVRLAKNSGISVSFLAKYFTSNIISEEIEKLKGGAAQQNLSLGQLNNLPIPLPPLPEQQRIVSILDEAFAAIAKALANAEQNLKNAKELFESYLQGVFEKKGEGWDEKTLEQVSKIFSRGKSRHRPRNYEKLYGGIYPFIQTGDIRNCNHYITEYSQTYSELGLAQSKLWPSGTICITIAANIAETGVLTFDACFPDSVIGLVVDEKYADRDFIEYLLQSFKARIQALGKGSAQANINMGTFENELFPFPSVTEQKDFVQKLDALSAETKKLEAIYQQKINDLEELKKSVLQKAFSGELKIVEAIS
jgi:type I restriction enzyme S subunit